jgi:transmembrane sensor
MNEARAVPDAVADEATEWFVRSRAHDFSRADRAALQRWLEADAMHRQAFQQAEGTWSALAHVRRPDRSPAVMSRRRAWQLALASAPLALGGGWLLHKTSRDDPLAYERDLASAPHGRLALALADSTQMALNVDTRASVQFAPDVRRVTLSRGEAFFDVAPDTRPFEVLAADVIVRAVGTQFTVRRLAHAVQVAVTRGRVELKRPSASASTRVTAGEAVHVAAAGILPIATPAAELASWRTGQLVLNKRPLPEVAAELSRYRERPIVIGNSGAAAVRVSGVVDLARPDAFLQALPEVAAVRVDEQGTRSVILSR